ncbi:HNH endonuclease [Phytohabitans sp. LJ34]|uniref:HNH endonuclease n=1 Tax=Phytohabitans sp. LJ34 TaxID=3452217 RepID=UPI003F8A3B4A
MSDSPSHRAVDYKGRVGGSGDLDAQLRAAMFAHLSRVSAAHPDGAPSEVINSFVFADAPMRLIVQPGIRKPAQLDAALTIRTTWTPPGAEAPYADEVSQDGSLRYKWRGTDPNHPDNRALREAMRRQAPLAYFYPVARGVYQAIYPVYLVDEDQTAHEFGVGLGQYPDDEDSGADTPLDRRYTRRLTLQRLHQVLFRPKVLRAYESRCALCRLRHAPLLDAAHILPDHHPHGEPVVPNGLAMCKIHHAAYDADIIGIRPDRVVEVRQDILAEIDGPMLRHGLQEMHGATMFLPRSRRDHPDPERLEERYTQFRAA